MISTYDDIPQKCHSLIVCLFLSAKQELRVEIILHAEIFTPANFVVIRAINLFDESKKGNFFV